MSGQTLYVARAGGMVDTAAVAAKTSLDIPSTYDRHLIGYLVALFQVAGWVATTFHRTSLQSAETRWTKMQ